VLFLLIMILSIFQIQGWSQSILTKNKEIKALRICDSLYTISLEDLQVCNYSDSVARKQLNSYKKLKNKDSLIIVNLKSQIEVKDKQILNYEQFKLKQKNKPLLFVGAGIVIGYLLRKELESLISRL
jgi:hypothetical protein